MDVYKFYRTHYFCTNIFHFDELGKLWSDYSNWNPEASLQLTYIENNIFFDKSHYWDYFHRIKCFTFKYNLIPDEEPDGFWNESVYNYLCSFEKYYEREQKLNQLLK